MVDVVTPNDSHGYLTRSAAAAGKHLICEKPLAPELATAEQMATDVEAAGVRAAICLIYRTWPATQVAKTMIDRDDWAPSTAIAAASSMIISPTPRAANPGGSTPAKAGAGVIADIGSHALDLASRLHLRCLHPTHVRRPGGVKG